MGAYLYVTAPSHVARARVRHDNGTEEIVSLSLYRYAYKPYGDHGEGRKLNARMAFKFGVVACRAAFKRSGRQPELLGVMFDDETKTLYPLTGDSPSNRAFRTGRRVSGLDDYDFDNSAPLTILEYVELPPGFTVKRPVGGKCSIPGGFAGFPGRDSSAWLAMADKPFIISPDTTAEVIRRKLCGEYAAVLADLTTEANHVRAVFTDDSVLLVSRGDC